MAVRPCSTIDTDLPRHGPVHLDVVDRERSLAFWRDLLGLVELPSGAGDGAVSLGVGGYELVVLHEGATSPATRGHAGLYHLALHLPDDAEFARVLARLGAARYPQAPTDHVFSKATYLDDPDGIGLELTLETPERLGSIEVGPRGMVVRDSEGRLGSGVEPLDLDEVFSHLHDDDVAGPLPDGTRVGHVHLHVGDLEAGWEFYRDAIGFEPHLYMERIGMADFGSGGSFPHRMAVNVWQGRGVGQRPAGVAGLRGFTLLVDDEERLERTAARLDAAGAESETVPGGILTRDPSGNRLEIRPGR